MRPADLPWPTPPEPRAPSEEVAEALDERRRLREALLAGADPGSVRWFAGELLEYHRREARPEWWWYFDRLGMSPEELVEDTAAIGELEADPGHPPVASGRSLIHTLRFPPQDHKLGPGWVEDPATGRPAGEILDIDDAEGTLRLKRQPRLADTPLPKALIPGGPYRDPHQRDAVLRVAKAVLAGDRRYPALRAILGREPEHLWDRRPAPRSRPRTSTR